ncbi:MotE family protein [Lachnoclostridium phytofermentans]|uniref:Magnesium transporter MgtE intracellular domain-containing protein n=1 Tax=Lachnoclostridium phytofermentans (strain ATCC 700394 / DSM 18823 / ISDg) TaxID=357809 RepID=A9KNF6_LACP7|nr:hypothetical protein [Lachnoclostridium phytofermentans]ABX43073.1 hypothetical protein Cphy_2712 [Lachnoclostridium phytofermentans ISDg]
MARKKRDESDKKKKSNGTLATILVVVGIMLIWLLLLGVLLRLDVGGIGTSLRPSFKNVPILKMLLPPVTEEQLIWEENYPYESITDAVNRIKELEVELDTALQSSKTYTDRNAQLEAEVARLKVFEDNVLAFENRVKAFDKNVVFNNKAPSIEEYKKYYEEINPSTAEEIYRLVLEQLQYDASIIEKAKIIKTMKPTQAAQVIEEMTADIEWTAKVLLSMKADESAAIFDKMNKLYSAKIFKKMADMDEDKLNSIKASLTN